MLLLEASSLQLPRGHAATTNEHKSNASSWRVELRGHSMTRREGSLMKSSGTITVAIPRKSDGWVSRIPYVYQPSAYPTYCQLGMDEVANPRNVVEVPISE